MKRTHFIAVLIGLAAMCIFATDASAYYDPGTGRFLSRDPIGTVNQPNAPNVAYPRIGQIAPAMQSGPVHVSSGRSTPQHQGGFIDRDPVQDTIYAAGMNLYEYVNANPLSFVDPLGLEKQDTKVKKVNVPIIYDWFPADHGFLRIESTSCGFWPKGGEEAVKKQVLSMLPVVWVKGHVYSPDLWNNVSPQHEEIIKLDPCRYDIEKFEKCILSRCKDRDHSRYNFFLNNCLNWRNRQVRDCEKEAKKGK